ncbi:MAG: penicillin acylase family protein, partial [Candidatus Dormibacteraeota bacterium]|nr:penicillin acylase family protein [Candidatus Dormibacteraeota bacterium]
MTRLAGKAGAVTIGRDRYGVPRVSAETAADAWFGMGYACAQDRLFQL